MIIVNFPEPYPEEIFYSICARYTDRMFYVNDEMVTAFWKEKPKSHH
jgi:hypothetical protein